MSNAEKILMNLWIEAAELRLNDLLMPEERTADDECDLQQLIDMDGYDIDLDLYAAASRGN